MKLRYCAPSIMRLLYDSLGSENSIYMEFAAGDHMFPAIGSPLNPARQMATDRSH